MDRLAFVKRAKTLGFSLGEIRELLVLHDDRIDACPEVKDLLQKKLTVVRDKQAELEKLEAHLKAALRKCNRVLKRQPKPQEPCPVLKEMANADAENGKR